MIFALLFFSLLFIGCGSESSSENALENTEISPLDRGKKIYRKFCIQCHGYDGTLMASGSKNLKESTLDSEARISFIKKGKAAMISYEGILTEEEIKLVSDYVATFQK